MSQKIEVSFYRTDGKYYSTAKFYRDYPASNLEDAKLKSEVEAQTYNSATSWIYEIAVSNEAGKVHLGKMSSSQIYIWEEKELPLSLWTNAEKAKHSRRMV